MVPGMTDNLNSLMGWSTGPNGSLASSVIYIALGDESIPLSERLEFLTTVLESSPSDARRDDLAAMVIEYFPDIAAALSV